MRMSSVSRVGGAGLLFVAVFFSNAIPARAAFDFASALEAALMRFGIANSGVDFTYRSNITAPLPASNFLSNGLGFGRGGRGGGGSSGGSGGSGSSGGGGGAGGGGQTFGGMIGMLIDCEAPAGAKWFMVNGPVSGQFVWMPGTPVATPSSGKNTIGNAGGMMICKKGKQVYYGNRVTLIGVSQ